MQTLTTPSPDRTSSRKLFYRINEVSKMTGLKPYVLRYWESEFPELSPEKDASDQRRYRARDIDTVLAIRKLLYEDRFTIKGARQRLKTELKKGAASSRGETEVAMEPAASKRFTPVADPTETSPASGQTIGQTLYHLRNEVGELLKMLGG